jgi:hypothetical protein
MLPSGEDRFAYLVDDEGDVEAWPQVAGHERARLRLMRSGVSMRREPEDGNRGRRYPGERLASATVIIGERSSQQAVRSP